MATKNKPVLGYRICHDCGERGSIHQAGGTRHSLYQRCGCGCVQSNGAFIQSRFWYETDWLDQPAQAPGNILAPDAYQEKLAAWKSQNAGIKTGIDTGLIDRGDQGNMRPAADIPDTGIETDLIPDLDRGEAEPIPATDRPADRPDTGMNTGKIKKIGILAVLAAVGIGVLRTMR